MATSSKMLQHIPSQYTILYHTNNTNGICGVMISVLASSMVGRGFNPRSG